MKVKVKSLSHVRLFATPWTVQARVLEWGAIAFSIIYPLPLIKIIIFVFGVLLEELSFIHILFINSYMNPEILPCLKRNKPG